MQLGALYVDKHPVTNAQYAEFLNAVASTDSFGGTDPTLYSAAMDSLTQGGITPSGSAGSCTYAVKSPALGHGPGGSDYTYDKELGHDFANFCLHIVGYRYEHIGPLLDPNQ